MNLLIFGGRLGRDPELRHIPSGDAVCSLSIPHSEPWTKDGQKQEKTEWMRCEVWGKQGENAAKYLKKGDYVTAYGKFESRKYTDKDGVERTSYQMKTERVEYGPKGGDKPASEGRQAEDQLRDFSVPQREPSSDSIFGSHTSSSLDDIPF